MERDGTRWNEMERDGTGWNGRQWRSEGGRGAAAPGRRPEGSAKILPKIFFNLYKEKFLKFLKNKMKTQSFFPLTIF